jgi:hypothetical protein
LNRSPDLLFAYDLAAMLGCTVAEIMDMGAQEFAGWAAWARMRPHRGK